MRIYIPPISDILYYNENARDSVKDQVAKLKRGFEDGNFSSDYFFLKELVERMRHITDDQTEPMLAINACESLKRDSTVKSTNQDDVIESFDRIVDISAIASVYTWKGITLLGKLTHLQKVLSFTAWMKNQYEKVLELDSCRHFEHVWNGVQLRMRGSHIDPDSGILMLTVQRKEGKTFSNFFRYYKRMRTFADGIDRPSLRVESNRRLDRAVSAGKFVKAPFKAKKVSVVIMHSTVPASYNQVVFPLVLHMLKNNLKASASLRNRLT